MSKMPSSGVEFNSKRLQADNHLNPIHLVNETIYHGPIKFLGKSKQIKEWNHSSSAYDTFPIVSSDQLLSRAVLGATIPCQPHIQIWVVSTR